MGIHAIGEAISYAIDKAIVSAMYRKFFSRSLNWENPTRYSEKLNVFKISKEAEDLYPYADKYAVRAYVEKTVGKQYLVPLLGVYDSPEDIDFSALPNQFVLKTTHGSAWNIICKDKRTLDVADAKRKLSGWMKKNYYVTYGRERQYKKIVPKIIAEKFLTDGVDGLTDYKIYCFAGKVYYFRMMTGRFTKIHKSFYDLNWKRMKFTFKTSYPLPPTELPKPKNMNTMIEIARKLSKPFKHVRVDLYNVDGKIYFGELTFTPANGQQQFDPESYDDAFGKLFRLN